MQTQNKTLLFNPEVLGFLAVFAFSFTLPLTKILTSSMNAYQIGIGRTLIASIVALILVIILKYNLPNKHQIKRLLLASLGISFGFPILVGIGMNFVPSSHGSLMLSILPILTAIFGKIYGKEKPTIKFWFFSLLGCLVVIIYSIYSNNIKNLYYGDIALFFAVLFAAFGYGMGGIVAKEIGGPKTILWILVLSLPITLPISIYLFWEYDYSVLNNLDLFSLLFLSLINSLFGFFLWYHALAKGGIIKISQIQLFQPFLTYTIGIIMLSETIDWYILILSILVLFLIRAIRKEPIINIK